MERSPYALQPLANECGATTKFGWSCVRHKHKSGECSGYPCPVDRCLRQAGHGREGSDCLKKPKGRKRAVKK